VPNMYCPPCPNQSVLEIANYRLGILIQGPNVIFSTFPYN